MPFPEIARRAWPRPCPLVTSCSHSSVTMPIGWASRDTTRPSTSTRSIRLSMPRTWRRVRRNAPRCSWVWNPIRSAPSRPFRTSSRCGRIRKTSGGRERHVQEEADPDVGASRPEQARDEHQLVVVDPDEVAGLGALEDGRREPLVRIAIGMPGFAIEADEGRESVQERPDRVVAVTLIEGARDLGREIDRHEAVLLLPGPEQLVPARCVARWRIAGPADPQPLGPFHDRREGGNEAAAAQVRVPLGSGTARGQGQAIGDDEEAVGHGFSNSTREPSQPSRRETVNATPHQGRGIGVRHESPGPRPIIRG